MPPRLIVLSGPHQGRSIVLDGDRHTVGRHSSNDLQLLEPEVSRRHAEIRRDGERWLLRDLDSRHGTFVGSTPIGERALAHGDVARVGRTLLLFLHQEGAAEPPGPSASELAGRSTVHQPPGGSLYLRPGDLRRALASGTAESVAVAADLNALLELSAAVHKARRLDELAGRVLELLTPALAADRGRFVLGEPGEDEERVVAAHGDAVAGAETLRLPLVAGERALGALELDHRAGQGFSERQLELAAAGAAITALALDNLRRVEGLRRENRRLQGEHGIVGESAGIRRVLELVARVAPVDTTVLVRGESGTGKELVARALHQAGGRADGPFLAVNCATLSETLLESELFGHERGAFTGAVARKIGKIEAAEGGTLFLDEVGEIPTPLQAKLLRVLQEREIERLGSTRALAVDVRVLAATNRDLETAIQDGGFREDLFYRLNVITLSLPALRERGGDVALLARHFAALHGRRLRRLDVGLSAEARRLLVAYDWPGNVRQLANAVERAVVLGDGELIRPEDLPDEVLESAATQGEGAVSDFQAAITETKKRLLRQALGAAGGNAAEAARRLGLHPNSLRRLVRQLDL